MADKTIGKVIHYFGHVPAAVIQLDKGAGIKIGDKVKFKGTKTDFSQTVSSLQVDHKDVDGVKAGDDFGLKVDQPVREGDQVFLAE